MLKSLQTLLQPAHQKRLLRSSNLKFFNKRKCFLLILLWVLYSAANAQNGSVTSYDVEGGHSNIDTAMKKNTSFSVSETNLKFSWENLPRNTGCTSNKDHDNFLVYNSGNRIDKNTPNTDEIKNYNKGGYNGSGSFELGPSMTFDIWFRYETGDADYKGCAFDWGYRGVQGTTDKIHAPTNFNVSFSSKLYSVQLNWDKGTAIDDSNTQYLIKKNGVEIVHLPGDKRSYQDFNIAPGTTYNYIVQTIVGPNAPAEWNRDVSVETSATISTSNLNLTATTDQFGKVKLTWPSLSAIDSIDAIAILRNGTSALNDTGKFTTLVNDLGKFATTYTDQDVVPGLNYSYELKIIDKAYSEVEKWRSNIAIGKSTPNGKLSGYVQNSTGTGVSGIVVSAKATQPLSDNVNSNLGDITYTATTDAQGYYEISGIYYNSNAQFTLTPKMPGYNRPRYNPATLTRKLTLDAYNVQNINFTDTAALTIKGKVTYNTTPDQLDANNTTKVYLPVVGADIILNGTATGVKTDANGQYAISVSNIGNYTIRPKLYDHKFLTSNNFTVTKDSISTQNITTSVSNVDFVDTKTDTLTVKVLGGCGGYVGEYATILLKSNSAGFTLDNSKVNVSRKIAVHAADQQTNIGIVDNTGKPASSNGTIKLVLPASSYNVQVQSVNVLDGNSTNSYSSTPIQRYFLTNYSGGQNINLAKRDSVTKIVDTTIYKITKAVVITRGNGIKDTITKAHTDTLHQKDTIKTVPSPQLAFVYHQGIQIVPDLSVFTSSPVKPSPTGQPVNRIIAGQNDSYKVPLYISEKYQYHNFPVLTAPLDSGVVHIYDEVGDIKDRQDSLIKPNKIKGAKTSIIYYNMKVGAPNITFPYLKTFEVLAQSGPVSSDSVATMIILGQRPRNGTFITTTPNIPFFVLHDPPGSNSSATLQKGSTYSTAVTTAINVGGSVGAYLEVKAGAGALIPIKGETGGNVLMSGSVEAGGSYTSNKTTNLSLSFNENFATSSDPSFVGSNGDVYVGASLNIKLAKTDVLAYNKITSSIDTSTSIAFDMTGFNTTYEYTEYHINNVIIPQLQSIIAQLTQNYNKAGATDKATYANQILQNRASLKAWQTAVANNATAKNNAKDKIVLPNNPSIVGNNISFSAGASYDNSLTTDTVSSASNIVDVFVNADAKVGLEVKSGDFTGQSFGATISIKFDYNRESNTATDNTKTVAYHLEDANAGNYYSVGLYEDAKYGTPIFKTVAGASSCPHENGTQFRAKPSMAILSGTSANQSNVPATQPAKFQITIANLSESEETQQYAIKLDPASNPNGAKVLVGGQDATNGAALFTLAYNKAFTIPVEVSRGALSNDYTGIRLVMYPTCEAAYTDVLNDNTGLTAEQLLDVHFQNSCSVVDLLNPGPNWLINQSNNNQLQATFINYDASKGSTLLRVGLQYRQLNTANNVSASQWITAQDVLKSALTDNVKDIIFDVSGLNDGQYQLQAYAVCSDNSINYSPIYSGTIDRKSAVAYGIPSPANGILGISDNISVTFNKTIACDDKLNPVKATLTRADNGQQIPVTYTCSGTGIQIKTVPENAINNLENVALIASLQDIKDASGNLIKDTLSWRFVVKRSDVYWDPANIAMNATESRDTSFSTKLKNRTAGDQSFVLSRYPSWLKPTVANGTIPPLGELNINFAIDSHLNPGEYIDTVTALVNGKAQYLYLDVSVLRSPPNWKVNPANYKYNMNITAQFSRNQTDTLISKDVRDKIAVFVGNECRGVGYIQYDDAQKKYASFITAYSNSPFAEKLTFRLWDAYPGIEYQSVDSLSFVSAGVVGTVAKPFIAHVGGVYQSIVLKKGWNWISLNVKNQDMSVRAALASLKSNPGDLIKTLTNNAYSQYSANMSWVGKLDSISLYSGYMINVAHDDTLRVLGQIQRNPVRIQLNKGWNWIGYPMPINVDLTTYLKNFNPADQDIVVSQEEFAQYNAATKSWAGSLKFLRPGKGYKLYSNSGISIPAFTPADQDNDAVFISALINQPANTPVIYNNPLEAISSIIDPNIKVNSTDFKNNMTVTAVISQDGGRVNDISRYEIRLSINNQLVSISALTRLPNGQAVAFIPVYGNDNQEGKKVDVVVYDKLNQKQYPITISAIKTPAPSIQNGSGLKVFGPVASKDIYQQQDNILGTVETPKVFALNGQADIVLTTTAERQQVSLGDTIHYTYHIKNNGPDAALNVQLTDTLKNAFDFISSSNSSLVFNSTTRAFTLNYTKILSGLQQDIIVSLRANKVGQFTIGQSQISLDNDPVIANNTAPALSIAVVDKRANEAKIFIPGLFTPNGDGINDRFVIVGLNDYSSSNTLIIYNKNYNEVYHKVNYQNDWSGDNLPMGSYGYFLKITTAAGVEKVFKGYITIAY